MGTILNLNILAKPDTILARIHDRPVLAAVVTTSSLLFPFALGNYRSFLKLKPNFGLANPLLWLLSLSLRIISRDSRTTKEYDAPHELKGSWLGVNFPRRRGDRPEIGWFPAPHRQMNQWAQADMHKRISTMLGDVAAAHPDTLEIRRSEHEPHTNALFVGQKILRSEFSPPNKTCKEAYGEVAHVHDGFEFSLHVVLAPQDCKKVIQNAWGERHPCAGR